MIGQKSCECLKSECAFLHLSDQNSRDARGLARCRGAAGRVYPKARSPAARSRPTPQTEEGPNDGRGGRKASAGSLIELIGMGAGLPMPSDVKVDKENVKVIMARR